MGQNFGVITKISEAEITLRELFQDAGGDWAERESTLLLQETESKEVKK
jgi:type IV pilus assembly protein PilP